MSDTGGLPDRGSISEHPLPELVRGLGRGGYSGQLVLQSGALQGTIGFVEGRVIEARAFGDLGPPAFLRLMGACMGDFSLERRPPGSVPPLLVGDVDELLKAFERRRAELLALSKAVGGLEKVWAVNYNVLRRVLHDLPDAINPVLRRLDGRRPVAQVAAECPLDEVLSLRVLGKLLSLGVLVVPEDEGDRGFDDGLRPSWSGESSGVVDVIGSDVPVDARWFEGRPPGSDAPSHPKPKAHGAGPKPRVDAPREFSPRPEVHAQTHAPVPELDRFETLSLTPDRTADHGAPDTEPDEAPAQMSLPPEVDAAPLETVVSRRGSRALDREPVAPTPAAGEPSGAGEQDPSTPLPHAPVPEGLAAHLSLDLTTGQAVDEPSDESYVLRPLPSPTGAPGLPHGPPANVEVKTWSSRGSPPGLPQDDPEPSEDERRALSEWLGEEDAFFRTPVGQAKGRRLTQQGRARGVFVAAALIVAGAFLGIAIGRACMPGEPLPARGLAEGSLGELE